MHWILSTPPITEKGTKCSCNLVKHEELIDEEISKKNLVVIGINDVSRYLMNEGRKKGWNYYWYIDQNESKIIQNSDRTPRQSTRIADIDIDDIGYCYGLISRTPNPLNPNSYLIIVAGSRREGQQVLTKWLTKPNNLLKMVSNNNNSNNNYIQILVKGDFKKIDENNIDIYKIECKEDPKTPADLV